MMWRDMMALNSNSLTQVLWLLLAFTVCYTQCADDIQPMYKHEYVVSDDASRVHIFHREQRDGDHVAGTYSLLEPNGQVRSVHYEVHGDKGYRAVVSFRSPHSRVHQAMVMDRKQPSNALFLAQPIANII